MENYKEVVKCFCENFSTEPTKYGGTYWTGVHFKNGNFQKIMSSCGSVGDQDILYIHGEKSRDQIEKEILAHFNNFHGKL